MGSGCAMRESVRVIL